jgi:anti-sigma B factor antagonist
LILPETTVVALGGDIDVETRATTRALLNEAVDAERSIVDLTGVGYIDSSGVTELMLAHNRRSAAGAEPLRLVIAQGTGVARLIELTGLDQLFSVFGSVEDARTHA